MFAVINITNDFHGVNIVVLLIIIKVLVISVDENAALDIILIMGDFLVFYSKYINVISCFKCKVLY